MQHRSHSATGPARGSRGSDTGRPSNRGWGMQLGVAIAAALVGFLAVVVTDLNPFDWINHTLTEIRGRRPASTVLAPKVVSPVAAADPKARLGTDSSASRIPLRLVLMRTIPGSTVHSGQALLGIDPAHPQTYMANAILENGARVDEIYADHVVLVKGLERTLLYVQGSARSTSGEENLALLNVGGPAEVPRTVHVSQEPTTNFVRPVPEYQNDAVVGYRVYPGAQSSVFGQLGLKSGDLITALNGQPVVGADETMQLLQGLTEGQSLAATIRRGTQELVVQLDGAVVERAQAARTAASMPAFPPR